MESGMNSYLDFADNDYMFFRQAYDSGNKGSALAALGQNICERYLKHIISEYANPETLDEENEKRHMLRTHSLNKLMGYISEKMEIEIPLDTELAMNVIDGFYFSTRYPGNESFIPTSRDIDKANMAVENTRVFTHEVCRNMEIENAIHEASEQDYDDYADFDFGDDERE